MTLIWNDFDRGKMGEGRCCLLRPRPYCVVVVVVVVVVAVAAAAAVVVVVVSLFTYTQIEREARLNMHVCVFFSCPKSWPADALQVVAERFLAELEMEDHEVNGCVHMCKAFHTGTRDLSLRFENELKRHNYVTPTSYLELINTFKTLLNKKRQ